MPPLNIPTGPTQPPMQHDNLVNKETAHLLAATFAAGVMGCFQLPLTSADPTIKDASLLAVISTGWAAWKVAYNEAVQALADPTWATPVDVANPKPTPTPTPVPTPTAPAPLTATQIQQLLTQLASGS